MSSLYTFSARTLGGETVGLDRYRDKVLLIVNTASECGFTPQYAGLQTLYEKYVARGFEVLGFPCNQFGKQEPGDASQISSFCEKTYSVSFPMFDKIDVKGPNAHPLYRYLTSEARGVFGTKAIKWNFTKFLIDRQGNVVRRYAPRTTPEAIDRDINASL
jgi:glutathione peroxidase